MLRDITNRRLSETSPSNLKKRNSPSSKENRRETTGGKKRQRLSKRTLDYLEVASEIVPGLYIGTNLVAKNKKRLVELGITHILSIDDSNNLTLPEGFACKHVIQSDEENSEIMKILPDCVKFISEGMNGGRVLVHCTYGNSRSSCVVVAYLMGKMDMSIQDAIALVSSKRAIAVPFEEHVNQLRFLNSQFYKITADGTLHDRYVLWAQLEGQLNLLASRQSTESTQTSFVANESTEPRHEEEAAPPHAQESIDMTDDTEFFMNAYNEEREKHMGTAKELEQVRGHLEVVLAKTQDWMYVAEQEKGKLQRKYLKAKDLLSSYNNFEEELEALKVENEELRGENATVHEELEKTKQRLLQYKQDMVRDLTTLMEDCERHEQETEALKRERENLKEYYVEEIEKRDAIIHRKDRTIAEKQSQIDAVLARLVREST